MATVFAGMAASLDGFIRSASGDRSWLDDALAPDEDYGFARTEARTGAYVIGATTYREMGGAAGVGAVPTYVVTHDAGLGAGRDVRPYAGDLAQLIDTVRSDIEPGKDICVFGGGQLVTQLLALGLIDELGVAVIPVVLGSGVPFFGATGSSTKLELIECRPFPSGIVILDYRIVRP
ncbi:dihydrofolate reductase family protein [Geodermatophilus sp. YIM 151500]|uniref:dihydrofolate reductase family protein n=1 Tax=Geodermatophilus sp. YIM 151500 TaxID=2984531 RepID=UPI0021E3F7A9|nr:dihydrofolate reductase family protein [Geodermatophilus sp. YIM 151500]MCV2490287.1 dihydrofolate reductase family protein [Geodermatophilus sp. YIM 151500]